MHSKRIVHRDLKLENVMVEDAGGRVVLIDFGLSNFWTPGSALRTHCGSAEYAAPEVFDQAFPLCPKVVTFRRIDGATFCLTTFPSAPRSTSGASASSSTPSSSAASPSSPRTTAPNSLRSRASSGGASAQGMYYGME